MNAYIVKNGENKTKGIFSGIERAVSSLTLVNNDHMPEEIKNAKAWASSSCDVKRHYYRIAVKEVEKTEIWFITQRKMNELDGAV